MTLRRMYVRALDSTSEKEREVGAGSERGIQAAHARDGAEMAGLTRASEDTPTRFFDWEELQDDASFHAIMGR